MSTYDAGAGSSSEDKVVQLQPEPEWLVIFDGGYDEHWEEGLEAAKKEHLAGKRIAQVRQEQIELLGSKALYDRVNRSFELLRFEPFFVKEQFKLFDWRKDYFHYNFDDRSWFANGRDDSHAIPQLITQHFDEVVAEVDDDDDPYSYRDSVYFESDEDESLKASNLYDIAYCLENSWWLDAQKFHGLSFSDALHMTAAAYQSQPLTLEHLAMKKVLEIKAPLTGLPRTLQEKADKGMFQTCEQVEHFVDDTGKEVLVKLKQNFNEQEEEEKDEEDGSEEELQVPPMLSDNNHEEEEAGEDNIASEEEEVGEDTITSKGK